MPQNILVSLHPTAHDTSLSEDLRLKHFGAGALWSRGTLGMLQAVSRGLSNSPPQRRTREDNHATLLVSWWCTGFALVIILLRVGGRFVRTERLFKEDKIMFWSIVPLLTRMALVHVIMLYGTNNATTDGLSAQGIHERSIGSRLVLASRIFYALFIWIAKWTVSQFLKRLAAATWSPTYERILRGIRAFLVLTFVGVVISTLTECQPFDHYWQVVPDPGPYCRNGYAQLLTMGISDVITDIALIVFPIPIVMRSQMPTKRKISLTLLFMLSVLLIVITIVRIVAIIDVHGRQQRRTLWASIEILAAAAVSNAVILGSFLRDRGVKKTKFKLAPGDRTNSEMPSINRTMTRQHWGNDSDEELFRSLASRMNSFSAPFDEERVIRKSPNQSPNQSTDLTQLQPNGKPSALGDIPESQLETVSRTRAMEKAFYQDEELDPIDSGSNGQAAPGQQERRASRRFAPSRSPRTTLPSLDTVARQDFAAFQWNRNQDPDDIRLGDAGGLLGPSYVPPPRTSVASVASSAEVSPLSSSPPTREHPPPSRDSRLSRSTLTRVSSPVVSGPEDMQLGDAGGLLP